VMKRKIYSTNKKEKLKINSNKKKRNFLMKKKLEQQ